MNNLSYVAEVTELNRYNRKAVNQSFDANAVDGDAMVMVAALLVADAQTPLVTTAL